MAPTYPQILAWVRARFNLGDARRVAAWAEMAWALMKADRISYAAIGRSMEGEANVASNIVRVANWCNNPLIDPDRIQRSLAEVLLAGAGELRGAYRVIPLAMDWHSYDNGAIEALRISLITGSRALPLFWAEIRKDDLTGRKNAIELDLLWKLTAARPAGTKLLILLDAGFRNPALLKMLHGVAYFAVRMAASVKIHTEDNCWARVSDLPVGLHQAVDFGWVHCTEEAPYRVRVVGCRITDQKPVRRGRRRRSPRRFKKTVPGLCVLATNLPSDLFEALDVIRLYARRFEIEHSFRDIKNATLGLDMEHVHLKAGTTYARLMCIVALAEICLWLVGSEAESRGLQFELTPSRPKDRRRVLSIVRVGRECLHRIDVPVETLIRRHLWPATVRALITIGRRWQDPRQRLRTSSYAANELEVTPPPRCCTNKNKGKGERQPCSTTPLWFFEKEVQKQAA